MPEMPWTLEEDAAHFAMQPVAAGDYETPEGNIIASVLKGTRLATLFGEVPWEIRNNAKFDRDEARKALRSERAKRFFDELLAEVMPRVQLFARGHRAAVLMASAVCTRLAIRGALA